MTTICIFIGISGVTCGGKTTLATLLCNFFKSHLNILNHRPNTKPEKFLIEKCIIVSQDDYFLPVDDIKHEKVNGLNHINWERLGALDMEKMINDLINIQKEASKLTNLNSNRNDEILEILKVQIILVEGFLILEDYRLLKLLHIKFHLHIPLEKCYERRIKRVYDPPDILGYFEMCVWPSYLNYHEQIKLIANVVEMNGLLTMDSLFTFAKDYILEKIFQNKL
ncbi:nicotinamide riboside kinase 1 [Condylostylus longicornis]|uniref:nicotinamide riboside kinase 1 n=1 Tax=Condylostylus longicornis TaxID=2530218 RepID=UPI00244DC095|nr:nicotinamide riboside kinase 1 [Condylostylus longicornis]